MALVLALAPLGTPGAVHAEVAPAPGFKVIARTSHVDYLVAKGRRVDIRQTEVFLARLSSLFGQAPQGWRIQYYRHASVGELSAEVGYAVSGVTDLATGRIDSAWDYHPHELVHAVAGRLGVPPSFFSEGLAVALTTRGRWSGQDMDHVAEREMAVRRSLEPFLATFGRQDATVAYAVAGSFVAFLLDRNGIEPMLAFLRGCGVPAQTYEGAFHRSYGRSVARLTIEWMAWLRRGEGARLRAWYEPEQWPAALRRDAPALALAAAPSVGSSPTPASLGGEPTLAAEPRLWLSAPHALAVTLHDPTREGEAHPGALELADR